MRVKLKGILKVTAKGKTYYYAYRGGPRLLGKPGSPEFMLSYNEAIAGSRTQDSSRFRSLVTLYKGSEEFLSLANSTRRSWSPWLDRISEHFGELRIDQFDRPTKIRKFIIRWRSRWSTTPRTADYGLQVLSRLLSHAIDPLGKISVNPCEGIRHLYKNDRSDIIWTDADISALAKVWSVEIMYAVLLAKYTGLRRGDLVRVSWSHIEGDAIILKSGKSKGRIEAIIPIHDELRQLLNEIPRRATTILTSSKKRPWTGDGLGSSFSTTMKNAGMTKSELNFNDLRGTAATTFYLAGFTVREIAETMAWKEERVDKIIRRYVGRQAAIRARIEKLKQDN